MGRAESFRFIEEKIMKCQKCDRPATFHYTELTGDKPIEIHLCEEHANEYLHKNGGTVADFDSPQEDLAQQVKKKVSSLQQTTRELMELEMRTCPICGASLQDFRKASTEATNMSVNATCVSAEPTTALSLSVCAGNSTMRFRSKTMNSLENSGTGSATSKRKRRVTGLSKKPADFLRDVCRLFIFGRNQMISRFPIDGIPLLQNFPNFLFRRKSGQRRTRPVTLRIGKNAPGDRLDRRGQEKNPPGSKISQKDTVRLAQNDPAAAGNHTRLRRFGERLKHGAFTVAKEPLSAAGKNRGNRLALM